MSNAFINSISKRRTQYALGKNLPLPQQEVCVRLRDRRWELVRRYNSALQSERQELTREQRGVEARLVQDCGGY